MLLFIYVENILKATWKNVERKVREIQKSTDCGKCKTPRFRFKWPTDYVQRSIVNYQSGCTEVGTETE